MLRKSVASLGVLVALLSSSAQARDVRSLENLREQNPPKAKVELCPMDSPKFWAHWATERGYEHLLKRDFKNAANCYDKAAEMYGKDSSWYNPDSPNKSPYHRFAVILRTIPRDSINISEETFEESANRALKSGNRELSVKLFELTALGYSNIGIEGYYGRFGQGERVLHRESRPWQEGHIRAGYFFEKAASLTNDRSEKRRLLEEARDFTASILNTNYCNGMRGGESDRVLADRYYNGNLPNFCDDAKRIVFRLDKVLVTLK